MLRKHLCNLGKSILIVSQLYCDSKVIIECSHFALTFYTGFREISNVMIFMALFRNAFMTLSEWHQRNTTKPNLDKSYIPCLLSQSKPQS